jgi:hypothetical protein
MSGAKLGKTGGGNIYFPGGFFDDPEQAVAPAIAGYPTHYYN